MNLRIIAAQLNLTVGDTAGNLSLINQAIERARDDWRQTSLSFPSWRSLAIPPKIYYIVLPYLDEVDAALDSLINKQKGSRSLSVILTNAPGLVQCGDCAARQKMGDHVSKKMLAQYPGLRWKAYFEPGVIRPPLNIYPKPLKLCRGAMKPSARSVQSRTWAREASCNKGTAWMAKV